MAVIGNVSSFSFIMFAENENESPWGPVMTN
jgi:hypothetical protein